MKLPSFFLGVIAGSAIVLILTHLHKSINPLRSSDQSNNPTNWTWADSLDAVNAAPNSHKVLFENDKIRILEVILEPFAFEPMHTHRFPSVMFGSDLDTSQFDVIYYPYSYDSGRHTFIAKDSVRQHQGGQSIGANTGNFMKPEGPHRVKNLSNQRIAVFRVELKNDTTK